MTGNQANGTTINDRELAQRKSRKKNLAALLRGKKIWEVTRKTIFGVPLWEKKLRKPSWRKKIGGSLLEKKLFLVSSSRKKISRRKVPPGPPQIIDGWPLSWNEGFWKQFMSPNCFPFGENNLECSTQTLRDNNIIVNNHMLVNIIHLLQAVRMGIYHTAFCIAITYTILQQVSTILYFNLSTFESCHIKTGLWIITSLKFDRGQIDSLGYTKDGLAGMLFKERAFITGTGGGIGKLRWGGWV